MSFLVFTGNPNKNIILGINTEKTEAWVRFITNSYWSYYCRGYDECQPYTIKQYRDDIFICKPANNKGPIISINFNTKTYTTINYATKWFKFNPEINYKKIKNCFTGTLEKLPVLFGMSNNLSTDPDVTPRMLNNLNGFRP